MVGQDAVFDRADRVESVSNKASATKSSGTDCKRKPATATSAATQFDEFQVLRDPPCRSGRPVAAEADRIKKGRMKTAPASVMSDSAMRPAICT